MTYRKLREVMNLFTEEQLDQDIIVYDSNKCFEIDYWTLSGLYGLDLPLDSVSKKSHKIKSIFLLAFCGRICYNKGRKIDLILWNLKGGNKRSKIN